MHYLSIFALTAVLVAVSAFAMFWVAALIHDIVESVFHFWDLDRGR